MRSEFPAFNLILRLQRLRDPQVQVWIMAGLSVLLLFISHLRAGNASGERKDVATVAAPRLLLAGARLGWSEEFAASRPRQDSRPVLVLAGTPSPLPKNPNGVKPSLLLRPAMEDAASRPWQALDRPLRKQLSQAGIPRSPLKVSLHWSGDQRGNAALVARRQHFSSIPDAAGFVIGNGSRSGDGEIQWLSHPVSLASGALEITLIGRHGNTTPAQLAAFAELLVHLEARSGHPMECRDATAKLSL